MVEAGRPISDPRMLAVRCLVTAARQRLLVPEAMARFAYQLDARDLAFAHEIVYGTFRFLPGLEQVLRQFCPKPKFPPEVHWLLLASLYELGFMRSADYATIDQANRNIRKLGFPRLKGLVNAVLRNAQRAGDDLWRERDQASWLLPRWLEKLLVKQHGPERVATWIKRWSERGLLSYWHQGGELPGDDAVLSGDDVVSPVLPHCRRREGAVPEAWLEQGVYIQNESSQLIAHVAVGLSPAKAIDLCSAPGGKACYLAAFSPETELTACDLDEYRLGLIRQNQRRLNLNFPLIVGDATQMNCTGEFDLVMLDAPCSGIGILGRHPEIKRHKEKPADAAMFDVQAALMKAAWQYVKPGGHVLYSVCSLDQNEIPALPEDAHIANDRLKELIPAGAPVVWQENGLLIEPDVAFDGFQAVLLQKP
ncbi:transcription antitermination factor NusB [Acanthopleuribacter pedis]|uniref:SAM-dependent MTase RsmB/NOP-type domain-containing protein n=1 Tax=Acanthopleuribacter pedis TaxID=442870 RepID=A0A8J7Q931_9BACT|nr:transcription antitermination factor NusB [Acanthopleuribacter pedis]MBO1319977.1 hypothetical protein [Acanthopleuribacter pedis]